MFKLLPEQTKKRLHREYVVRLIIVTLFFVLFIQAIGAVSLLPAFFLSRAKNDQVLAEQKTLGRLLEEEKDPELALDLERAKTQIRQLDIDQTTGPIADLFEKVISDRPFGIQISSFELLRRADNANELRIIGRAPNRDSLVLFTKTLEKESIFSKVTLPVSDLARNKDISFSILITGTF